MLPFRRNLRLPFPGSCKQALRATRGLALPVPACLCLYLNQLMTTGVGATGSPMDRRDERVSHYWPLNQLRRLQAAQASDPVTIFGALRSRWTIYLMEGAELGFFMLSAATFGTLLFHPGSPIVRVAPSLAGRRTLMGIAMALTAIAVIHSPFGKRSGAHFNPAITITYYWLGKVRTWDAVFYVVAQFVGGLAGMLVAVLVLGRFLADPSVRYIVTVPGTHGVFAAFVAELLMAALLMTVVLRASNHPRWAPYTGYAVGLMVVLYIAFFSPFSGFSINPARTASSGFVARIWTAMWVYFTAPLLGMIAAAEFYLRGFGGKQVYCAKLLHATDYPCPFYCRFAEMFRSGNPTALPASGSPDPKGSCE
jgi:aquaporin Z